MELEREDKISIHRQGMVIFCCIGRDTAQYYLHPSGHEEVPFCGVVPWRSEIMHGAPIDHLSNPSCVIHSDEYLGIVSQSPEQSLELGLQQSVLLMLHCVVGGVPLVYPGFAILSGQLRLHISRMSPHDITDARQLTQLPPIWKLTSMISEVRRMIN